MERTEFDNAFQKAKQKYPRIHMGIAWRFVLDFEAALRANNERQADEQQPFGLLIRLALNNALLSAKEDRTMYAALIGFLFGKRGQYSIARRKKNKLSAGSRRRKQPIPSYDVGVTAKGQLVWKL